MRIATVREWLVNDVNFDAAVVNGASLNALEGYLVMVLEAEGRSYFGCMILPAMRSSM